MKKAYVLSLLLGLVAVPALQAIQVATVGGYGPWQTGLGGEITLKVISGLSTSSYVPTTKDQVPGAANTPSFQTFCAEAGESIYGNSTYDADLNNITLLTGTPLSQGAAWLYSEFAQGLLSYDYANAINRKASADKLQKALWALMASQNGYTYDNTNPYMLAAESQFGTWANANAVAGGNNYGVSILNLWAPGDVVHRNGYQDVFYYHVPDGGMTVVMLGMGLSGLAFVSRRNRR